MEREKDWDRERYRERWGGGVMRLKEKRARCADCETGTESMTMEERVIQGERFERREEKVSRDGERGMERKKKREREMGSEKKRKKKKKILIEKEKRETDREMERGNIKKNRMRHKEMKRDIKRQKKTEREKRIQTDTHKQIIVDSRYGQNCHTPKNMTLFWQVRPHIYFDDVVNQYRYF